MPGSSPVEHQVEQRRTLNVLRLAVVPGNAAVAGSVAVVSLLATELLGSDRWAGLASASFTFGSALTAIPLSAAMRRHGRRRPLATALLVGAAGALVAATGGQFEIFGLFLLGMVLFGAGQAATLQGRYVAADLAPEHQRATAIGAIVWIGTLGAVGGPVLAPFEQDFGEWIGLDRYIGPYLFASALFALSAVVYVTLLRPDPLAVIGAIDPNAERTRPLQQVRSSFGVIRSSPGASLGLMAMAGSQAAMVAVMTMTPPHMRDHGHSDLSAYVIAVHIVGMFGLAPLVGRFVSRFGSVAAIQCGAVVLGAGTIVTVAAGYAPALMFVGLFFLGLGWNLGLIAGTTLLTASVPAHTRVEAQGTGDLTLSSCGAIAAFSSGFIKEGWGFHMLANAAAVLAAVMLASAWFTKARFARLGRRPAA